MCKYQTKYGNLINYGFHLTLIVVIDLERSNNANYLELRIVFYSHFEKEDFLFLWRIKFNKAKKQL